MAGGREALYPYCDKRDYPLYLPSLLHCPVSARFASIFTFNASPNYPNERELQITLGRLEQWDPALSITTIPDLGDFYSCLLDPFASHSFLHSLIHLTRTYWISHELARNSYTQHRALKSPVTVREGFTEDSVWKKDKSLKGRQGKKGIPVQGEVFSSTLPGSLADLIIKLT